MQGSFLTKCKLSFDSYVSSAKFLNSEYLPPLTRVRRRGPKRVRRTPTPIDMGMMTRTMTHPETPPETGAGVGGRTGGRVELQ